MPSCFLHVLARGMGSLCLFLCLSLSFVNLTRIPIFRGLWVVSCHLDPNHRFWMSRALQLVTCCLPLIYLVLRLEASISESPCLVNNEFCVGKKKKSKDFFQCNFYDPLRNIIKLLNFEYGFVVLNIILWIKTKNYSWLPFFSLSLKFTSTTKMNSKSKMYPKLPVFFHL